MIDLEIERLRKTYRDKVVLEELTLGIKAGSLVSLLGPSGCGKTTTLNIVAGFVEPDQGRILLGGSDVTTAPPYRRDTAVVFQNYALFPHMKVAANVAYGLRAKKISRDEARQRVSETLDLMGIMDLAERYPAQLSGGQQQRVAVARAVAVQPGVLLMDEPLSNLDAKLRQEIRVELRQLQRRLNQTILFVTHDQEEALTISDRVVIMNKGMVEQDGTPTEVYERPRTTFAADFMGVKNIWPATAVQGIGVETGDGILLPLPEEQVYDHIGVRPTKVQLEKRAEEGHSAHEVTVRMRVENAVYKGDTVQYSLARGAFRVMAETRQEGSRAVSGDEVMVTITSSDVLGLEENAALDCDAQPGDRSRRAEENNPFGAQGVDRPIRQVNMNPI